jgi:hypothetical protein
MEWFPVIGAILLTAIIAYWIIVNRRKIGDALLGREASILTKELPERDEYLLRPGERLVPWPTQDEAHAARGRLHYDTPRFPFDPGRAVLPDAEVTSELWPTRHLTLDDITRFSGGGPNEQQIPREAPQKVIDEICWACDTVGGHTDDCPVGILEQIGQARVDPENDGEPLSNPPQPNLGGEGNPDYAGPHYESVHELGTRFVPYDMLRDPPEGVAVIPVKQSFGIVGPIRPKDTLDDDGDEQ